MIASIDSPGWRDTSRGSAGITTSSPSASGSETRNRPRGAASAAETAARALRTPSSASSRVIARLTEEGVIPSLRAAWLTERSAAVATNGTMPTNRSAVEALMPWRRYTDARADESPRKPISRLRPPGELGSGGVGAERDHELVGRLRVRGLHVRDELLLLRGGGGRFTRTQTIDLGAIRHEVLALPGEQRL